MKTLLLLLPLVVWADDAKPPEKPAPPKITAEQRARFWKSTVELERAQRNQKDVVEDLAKFCGAQPIWVEGEPDCPQPIPAKEAK